MFTILVIFFLIMCLLEILLETKLLRKFSFSTPFPPGIDEFSFLL